MKKLIIVFASCMLPSLLMIACRPEDTIGEREAVSLVPVLPATPYDYSDRDKPAHITGSDRISVDDDKATLGRVLFYDKLLSVNHSTSCASCHLQRYAFSDGQQASTGISLVKTPRNAMAIMNAGRENGYFWDLRESDLQSMVVKPIQNHVEMGFEKLENVAANINGTAYYRDLFLKAFGSGTATPDLVGEALAHFLTSMKSHHSKYDEGVATGFRNFTAQELHGKSLFTEQLHCKNCHAAPDFNSHWFGASANIGLDLVYKDKGVGAFPGRGGFDLGISGGGEGAFKIPSLRNIELTAPYMHDGRYKTLEDVVEHYNSRVQNHPNLDWNFKALSDRRTGSITGMSDKPVKLNLTPAEKAALVAFLKTLTDHRYTTDIRFSNPFAAPGL